MANICIHFHKTPIGEMILGDFEGKLCILDFKYRRMRTSIDKRIKDGLNADYIEKNTPLLVKAKKQIDEFLNSERTKFDIDYILVGSDFQKQVWEELLKVPFGQTSTYMDLSKKIGNVKAVRAVANANGANTLALLVPCHRIIGSDGNLVGYAGGLRAKRFLLDLESKNLFTSQGINL